jgi:hypothetical protein
VLLEGGKNNSDDSPLTYRRVAEGTVAIPVLGDRSAKRQMGADRVMSAGVYLQQFEHAHRCLENATTATMRRA